MQSLVYNVPSLFSKYENEGIDVQALTRNEISLFCFSMIHDACV